MYIILHANYMLSTARSQYLSSLPRRSKYKIFYLIRYISKNEMFIVLSSIRNPLEFYEDNITDSYYDAMVQIHKYANFIKNIYLIYYAIPYDKLSLTCQITDKFNNKKLMFISYISSTLKYLLNTIKVRLLSVACVLEHQNYLKQQKKLKCKYLDVSCIVYGKTPCTMIYPIYIFYFLYTRLVIDTDRQKNRYYDGIKKFSHRSFRCCCCFLFCLIFHFL